MVCDHYNNESEGGYGKRANGKEMIIDSGNGEILAQLMSGGLTDDCKREKKNQKSQNPRKDT
jgi:hypothetical protein